MNTREVNRSVYALLTTSLSAIPINNFPDIATVIPMDVSLQ